MENYIVLNSLATGASHISTKKPCQDYSLSFKDDKNTLAIISDGHGDPNCFRSDRGAEFACEAAKKSVLLLLSHEDEIQKNTEMRLRELEEAIIFNWYERVKSDYLNNPFTEDEIEKLTPDVKNMYKSGTRLEKAYGCTLIAVALTEKYCFGIQIGDGKCVAIYENARYEQPIPWDENCTFQYSTSLCGTNAKNEFRHFYTEDLPIAIFAASDGVDESFGGDENLNKFYYTLSLIFQNKEFDTAKNELTDYLKKLTAKGSLDDVSVAGIINKEAKFLFDAPTPPPETSEDEKVKERLEKMIKEINSEKEELKLEITALNQRISELMHKIDSYEIKTQEYEKKKTSLTKKYIVSVSL